jgi:RNA polymerase sigma-70 factor (ECF subfamily)
MSRDDHELISKAVSGDQIALQKLLVSRAAILERYAAGKMPKNLRELVDPDDIVQQTYVEAFRSISRFRAEEAGSFQAWLLRISDHVIKDTVKRYKRAKRGGQFQRVHRAKPTQSQSVADLVGLLSAGGHTPSQSVMGHEAVEALTEAIDGLPEDYRQAVQIRLLEGKSLEETATIMNRSPRAVHSWIERKRKCAPL